MFDVAMFFAHEKLLCIVSPCHWLFLILTVPAWYLAHPSGAQVPGVFLLGEHSPTDVAQFGVRLDRSGGNVDWEVYRQIVAE